MELYVRVRRAVLVEGRSQRSVARVWSGAHDGTQDVGIFDSAGLPAERATEAA